MADDTTLTNVKAQAMSKLFLLNSAMMLKLEFRRHHGQFFVEGDEVWVLMASM